MPTLLRVPRASSCRTSSTATRRSRSRASASRAASTTPTRRRRRRRSSTRCSAPARSGTRAGRPPRRSRPRRSRGATSTSSAGSSSTPTTDPSECHDLAAEHPDKLQELIALWWAEAGTYQALPLESRGAHRDPRHRSGRSCRGRAPATSTTPAAPRCPSRSRRTSATARYTIAAEVEIDTAEAGGVIFSQGSRFGGHALYVKDGKLEVRLQLGRRARPDGRVRREGPDGPRRPLGHLRAGGRGRCRRRARSRSTSATRQVGEATIMTQPGKFGLGGGGLVVGRSGAEPVTDDYAGERAVAVRRRHDQAGGDRRQRRVVRRPRRRGARGVRTAVSRRSNDLDCVR